MKKLLALGVVAIALLTGAAILVIELAGRGGDPHAFRWSSEDPGADPEPEAAAAEPEAVATSAEPARLDTLPPLRAARPPPDPAETWAVLSIEPPPNAAGTIARASETWVSVPLRPRDLRTLWLAISQARPDLARCWAREGRGEVQVDARGAMTVQGGTPATLMLQLESAGDTLRIVGAPVDVSGDDRTTTVRCAQQKLVGLTVPLPRTLAGSPLAEAGTRTEMRFVLQ